MEFPKFIYGLLYDTTFKEGWKSTTLLAPALEDMHLLVCMSTYVAVVRGHLLVPCALCAILCVRGSLARIFARSMKFMSWWNPMKSYEIQQLTTFTAMEEWSGLKIRIILSNSAWRQRDAQATSCRSTDRREAGERHNDSTPQLHVAVTRGNYPSCFMGFGVRSLLY